MRNDSDSQNAMKRKEAINASKQGDENRKTQTHGKATDEDTGEHTHTHRHDTHTDTSTFTFTVPVQKSLVSHCHRGEVFGLRGGFRCVLGLPASDQPRQVSGRCEDGAALWDEGEKIDAEQQREKE